MSLINVTDIPNGTTAEAEDVNRNINTIVDEINGQLDNANISSSASISASKLNADAGMGAWTDYSPTWTATTDPDIGDGELVGRYIQIGKTVHFNINLAIGSTTNLGDGVWQFGLPVPVSTSNFWTSSATPGQHGPNIGGSFLRNVGVSSYWGWVLVDVNVYGNQSCVTQIGNESTAMANLTHNSPFVMSNGDNLRLHGTYEAG